MIFDGWTIELEHVTAGVYTPTQLIATDLQFSIKEEDIPFVLRAYLEQEIIFRGADFDWIKAIDDSEDRCEDIKMTVGNGSLELVYYLPLPGAKFDVDLKEVPMKAKINDAYRCILDSWEDEFNLLDYGDAVTIRPYIGGLETNVVTTSLIADIDAYIASPTPPSVDPSDPSWRVIYIDARYNIGSGSWDATVGYVRETYTTTCVSGSPVPPPGSGWVLRINDCAGTGTAFYTRALPVYDTDQTVITSTSRLIVYRIPTQTVDNGRRLLDVLQARLDETCGIDVKSRLFTQNVTGLPTYSNSVYDQKENIEHLIIFQRSDIKRPAALENATKGITTVKDILESLWATFRAYWWINDKGALVIEHESANTGQTPINLTLSHPDQLKGTNKYESIQDELPRGQYFGWDESYGDPDFDGLPLLYPNACSDGREDIQAGWSTDAGTLFSNGERGNDVGFVLIAALEIDTDQYGMTSELGAITGLSKLNGHLSWANLQAVYHQHRRPFLNGLMNAAAHTFESRKPTKTQEVAVIVPEIDFEDLVDAIQDPPSRPRYTTGLGTGEMKAARYSVKNRTLTLEINHD